jgi:hypothetical protein
MEHVMKDRPYQPTRQDFESAYRQLANPGQSILVEAVIWQLEESAARSGIVLAADWERVLFTSWK